MPTDMISRLELTCQLLRTTVDLSRPSGNEWSPRKNAHLATAHAALHLLTDAPKRSVAGHLPLAVLPLIEMAQRELMPGTETDGGSAPGMDLLTAVIYLEAVLYRLSQPEVRVARRILAEEEGGKP